MNSGLLSGLKHTTLCMAATLPEMCGRRCIIVTDFVAQLTDAHAGFQVVRSVQSNPATEKVIHVKTICALGKLLMYSSLI